MSVRRAPAAQCTRPGLSGRETGPWAEMDLPLGRQPGPGMALVHLATEAVSSPASLWPGVRLQLLCFPVMYSTWKMVIFIISCFVGYERSRGGTQ